MYVVARGEEEQDGGVADAEVAPDGEHEREVAADDEARGAGAGAGEPLRCTSGEVDAPEASEIAREARPHALVGAGDEGVRVRRRVSA